MSLHFRNTSRPIGRRGRYEYYEWRLFLDEPPAVLEQVDRVEYRLHPTFPNPIRTIDDRASRFELVSAGWGELTVLITVYMRDGTQLDTEHRVQLGQDHH
jgi:transcription initiation factor IIF auxiliary subunit